MDSPKSKEVLILGAGVSGLTTGLVFQSLGYTVKIWAQNQSPHTTSDIAPAIWYPEKLEPQAKTREWAVRSYKKFLELSRISGSGVMLRTGRKYFHRPMGDPWWKENVLEFRRLAVAECGDAVCGYEFSGFVIDMSIYLTSYLAQEFKRQGGTAEKRQVRDMKEAFSESDIVINCIGLSSRALFQDKELIAKRGQLVRISKIENQNFLLDTDHQAGMIYIVPRTQDCILGTVSEEGNENLEVDPLTSQKIIERCALYYPELASKEILGHSVGIRPFRQTVRVEKEVLSSGKTLFHNYGHGGNGVTLSWGCAFEVAGVKEEC